MLRGLSALCPCSLVGSSALVQRGTGASTQILSRSQRPNNMSSKVRHRLRTSPSLRLPKPKVHHQRRRNQGTTARRQLRPMARMCLSTAQDRPLGGWRVPEAGTQALPQGVLHPTQPQSPLLCTRRLQRRKRPKRRLLADLQHRPLQRNQLSKGSRHTTATRHQGSRFAGTRDRLWGSRRQTSSRLLWGQRPGHKGQECQTLLQAALEPNLLSTLESHLIRCHQ